MPVGSLLAGMRWDEVDLGAAGSPAGTAGRRREARSLDAVIARRCREGQTVHGMAREVLVSESTVRKIIARLRGEGRNLGPYGATAEKEFLLTHADIAEEVSLDREARASEPESVDADAVKTLIGTRVRRLRRELGLSQEILCAAAGLNRSAVSDIERLGLNGSLTYLIRLAASLHVPCSMLTSPVRWDPRARSFVLDPDAVTCVGTTAERIGRNARRIRQESGLSEATIGRRVGRCTRYFNRVELGTANPKPVTLIMLAAALEVEPEALLLGVSDWYHCALPPIAVPEEDEAAELAARQARIPSLWTEGLDLSGIGEAVDLKPGTVFGVLNRLREVGAEVPYRKDPVTARHLSTRLRRHRRGIPSVADG